MSEPITNEAPAVVVTPVENVEILRLRNERALAEFETPFTSAAAFTHYMKVAEVFAQSSFIPAHFRGKPGDCLIGINLALRMGEDPLMVLQNTHAIGGKPAFMTAFMVARANCRAGLRSPIKWRTEQLSPATLKTKAGYEMPNVKVYAYAVDKFGETCEAFVTSTMAIEEGWPSNAKYRSMPEHMLEWRAAAFLIRKYWPETMMGMQTAEELETMPAPVAPRVLRAVDLLAEEPARLAQVVTTEAEKMPSDAPTEPEKKDEAPQDKPADPPASLFDEVAAKVRMSPDQVRDCLETAERQGVSAADLEGFFTAKLEELEGETALAVEARVVDAIKALNRQAKKGAK